MRQIFWLDWKKLASSLFLSMLVLLILSYLIEFFEFDRLLADQFYQLQGNRWAFKDFWITETVIHKGGKYLSIAGALVVLIAWMFSSHISVLHQWQKRLRFLFVATVLGTIVVSFGKIVSHISCPWDFSRYGGTLEYISLSNQLLVRNGSQCFPAGHASAGYAWIALYFVGLYSRSVWRWLAFSIPFLIGLLFGFSQQLRGAHFISHDLWTFGICWMVSLTCYHFMLKPYEPYR